MMAQRREGTFCILRKNTEYYDYEGIHQYFTEVLTEEEEGFSRIKTLDENNFSIPFQDIWLNPEKTHQLYLIKDYIVNTTYLRILCKSDREQESISKLSEWFYCYRDGELYEAADEALIEANDDQASHAIFSIAVGIYVYDANCLKLFKKYLESSSVKVRLATIRAIGFQLWEECIPLLEKVIQKDSHRAVRNYAREILRQIQEPSLDPDDLYEHPENYPNSLESVTDKAFQKLPQLRDDLQVWMKERGIDVIDALELYQYLNETEGEIKPNEDSLKSETIKQPNVSKESEEAKPEKQHKSKTGKSTKSTSETPSKADTKPENAKQQQELANDKEKPTELKSKSAESETKIERDRKTDSLESTNSGKKKLTDEPQSDVKQESEKTKAEKQNKSKNSKSAKTSSKPDTKSENAELKKESVSDKEKLAELKSKLKKAEERVMHAKKTNIFGRPQSGVDERERDKLIQQINEIQQKIEDA